MYIISVPCTNSSVCDGKAGVVDDKGYDDKGYCDFGESNSGVCKYCSDVSGNCTDPATNATNGEQECKDICEGKYSNILQSHGKYLMINRFWKIANKPNKYFS